MNEEETRILDYIVVCVSEFANKYDMRMEEAFSYLSTYNGIEFLKEFYDVEHILSFDDAISDIVAVCRRNGGVIV